MSERKFKVGDKVKIDPQGSYGDSCPEALLQYNPKDAVGVIAEVSWGGLDLHVQWPKEVYEGLKVGEYDWGGLNGYEPEDLILVEEA